MKALRQTAIASVLAAALLGLAPLVASAQEADAPPRQHWSFSGPFGTFDQAQLQRGFKIYREVCSNCHSLKLLAFRNLADAGGPGFSEAQAATIAAGFQVTDGPNDQGEMFQRSGKLADAVAQVQKSIEICGGQDDELVRSLRARLANYEQAQRR